VPLTTPIAETRSNCRQVLHFEDNSASPKSHAMMAIGLWYVRVLLIMTFLQKEPGSHHALLELGPSLGAPIFTATRFTMYLRR